ncbi:MAG TPA: glucose-6-phosphate isomerase family protein [Verrucomicrobiae bacterium]|nr:glucose-6-phosphate isomerase family protein [Verrucomicrobiae bacterium]
MFDQLLSRFDSGTGLIEGAKPVQRRLSDMRGCYVDDAAYVKALAASDPLIYAVASVEPAHGPGDLHYGLGRIMPGRVGREYFMTKGHLHEWREAAEIYLGLSGQGMMLLEDEASGESRALPLLPNQAVYVPGHTVHRTMNIGNSPLVYLGVYPARAGHDYRTVAQRNFRMALLEQDGRPVLVDRASLTSGP